MTLKDLMKLKELRMALMMAGVLSFGSGVLVGCEDDGGMEEIGESMDDAADDAADSMEDAADDAGDAMDDATN